MTVEIIYRLSTSQQKPITGVRSVVPDKNTRHTLQANILYPVFISSSHEWLEFSYLTFSKYSCTLKFLMTLQMLIGKTLGCYSL